MDYKEAVKKVQATKPKENLLLITLGYDNKILLPHKDGITLLAALNSAEQFCDPYGKQHSITELDRSKISVSQMSHAEYERYKIAALLGITVDEVKEHALQAG